MNNYKNFLLTLLFITVSLAAATSHDTIIFLWDLHHVLFKPHKTFATILNYPHKARAFKNKKLQHKIWKLLLKGMFKESASDHFIHLAQEYNNPYLKELIIKASSAQRPMANTVAIIEELAQNGYTHHVGSNIGLTVFQSLTDPQQSPQFVSIFKHFDLAKSHVVAYNAGTIIKKPNPLFFRTYLEKNNIDLSKSRVIFIDDKKNNIAIARSLGFEAVHFRNAAQLRKKLAAMGIKIRTD